MGFYYIYIYIYICGALSGGNIFVYYDVRPVVHTQKNTKNQSIFCYMFSSHISLHILWHILWPICFTYQSPMIISLILSCLLIPSFESDLFKRSRFTNLFLIFLYEFSIFFTRFGAKDQALNPTTFFFMNPSTDFYLL